MATCALPTLQHGSTAQLAHVAMYLSKGQVRAGTVLFGVNTARERKRTFQENMINVDRPALSSIIFLSHLKVCRKVMNLTTELGLVIQSPLLLLLLFFR